MNYRSTSKAFRAIAVLAIAGWTMLAAGRAEAEALLLVDAASGRVLHAENAGQPWYPASVTKMMTTYVTLSAVTAGRIKLDSLVAVSERALAQQPSKMGFPVGTQMTVDNALKMLMVKSANDIAVVLAEGVSGSVEAFAKEMNEASARLGMTQSHWVNPNGLPDDNQVSSARDMAILARALLREFPQHSIYWSAPAIRFGRRVFRNYNRLISRYQGADGMKTGFICASGFNLVATATRGGRQLIAVVLGSPSGKERAETAARLLEHGFSGGMLAWLMPSLGTLDSVQTVKADPPNLREQVCGGRNRGKTRTDHASEEDQPAASNGPAISAFASVLPGAGRADAAPLLGAPVETMPPITVSVIAPKGAPQDPDALVRGPRKPRTAKQKGPKSAAAKSGKTKSDKTKSSAPGKGQASTAKKSGKAAPKAAAPARPPARPAAKPKAAAADKKK